MIDCLDKTIFSHHRTRELTLWLWAIIGLCACGMPAYGQLRSGRTERSLYSNQAVSVSQAPDSSPESMGMVRSASGQRPAAVISSGASPSRSTVSLASSMTGLTCDDCGDSFGPISTADNYDGYDNYDSSDYAGSSYFPDCGPYGCDDLGCDSCQSGCADLTPTCSSMVCTPGCGPLRWLWDRMSVRAEVPLYFRPSQGPPPLVTTSPDGTDADIAGELGQRTTSILVGNRAINDKVNAGVRITLSAYLDAAQHYNLMFRYWNAGNQKGTVGFSSDAYPILARPFLDTSVTPAVRDTQLVAFSDQSTGNIAVRTFSKVDGLELTLKRMIYMDRFTRIDWLYGYQYVSIQEGLSISSNTTVTGNLPGLLGNMISVSDNFRTRNDFNGMAYGLKATRQVACWKLETLLRLGLGNLRRKVNINGTTTTTANGSSLTSNQGLLARNTNGQPFADDTFVVVPEIGINLARQIRPGLDFTIGYNYMVIPKVGRAAQQINNNLAVNLSDPLTGSLDPALNFREKNYWLSSLGLGLQWRY